MADAVTSQTLSDGDRTAVMKFTNISDGSGGGTDGTYAAGKFILKFYGYSA